METESHALAMAGVMIKYVNFLPKIDLLGTLFAYGFLMRVLGFAMCWLGKSRRQPGLFTVNKNYSEFPVGSV